MVPTRIRTGVGESFEYDGSSTNRVATQPERLMTICPPPSGTVSTGEEAKVAKPVAPQPHPGRVDHQDRYSYPVRADAGVCWRMVRKLNGGRSLDGLANAQQRGNCVA